MPLTRKDPAAENTGSSVLMVCVSETATAANETGETVSERVQERGKVTALRNSLSGFSYFTKRVVQKKVMISRPTARCTAETNHGNGK